MSFGWEPIHQTIVLANGQDFIMERRLENDTWPQLTEIWIKWDNGQKWDAAVGGKSFKFTVQSAISDTIPQYSKYVMWVKYPDGGQSADYKFFYGACRRVS